MFTDNADHACDVSLRKVCSPVTNSKNHNAEILTDVMHTLGPGQYGHINIMINYVAVHSSEISPVL